MLIQIDPGAVRKIKWHEYVMRFAFGGMVTALAGIIASICGPIIGGLFLACPAIFPASATLIEKHERQKKQRVGLNGTIRGRDAAGIDAVGAAMGSVGLVVFGAIAWKLLPHHRSSLALILGTLAWFLVSALLWYFRKRHRFFKIW